MLPQSLLRRVGRRSPLADAAATVVSLSTVSDHAPITRNGAPENYVFRVSAVDELVDKALVDYAIAKHSTKKPGMILINNPWGESNEKGLKAALDAKKIPYAGIEKFETNDVDVVPQ